MRVALRVDASAVMGTGHLQRCLSLAHALVDQGAEVTLVTRALDGVAAQVLQPSGLPVIWLAPADACGTVAPSSNDLPPHHAWAKVPWQQDASETCDALSSSSPDWVCVDHYAFDAHWHDAVRQGLKCRVLVIDDIADRALSPDILLDHNWAPDHRAKYQGRLTKEPVWLTGPRFALLSAAYRAAPRYRFNPEVRSIGIFMGGTDPGGITAKVLQCVRAGVGYNRPVEVVSTSANPHLSALRAACTAYPDTTLTLDEPNLAGFLARHDLHVGAGGGALWERCCIGVPTIALVVAENQAASVPFLHGSGVLHAAYLPGVRVTELAGEVLPLADVLNKLLVDVRERRFLATNAAALADGRGAERVALCLTRESLHLLPAATGDAPMLYAWRNHPLVRGVSLNTNPIDYGAHLDWINKSVRAVDRWLFVALVGRLPVGTIRFDRVDRRTLEVSLYLDPDLQGLGLGKQLLQAGECAVSQKFNDGVVVHAVVSPGNDVSHRLFQSSGYEWEQTHFLKSLKHQSLTEESMQCGLGIQERLQNQEALNMAVQQPASSALRVISLRPITSCSEAQQLRVRELRNDESVRASMYTDHEISLAEHLAWIERLRSDQSSIVFVVLRDDERPIGVVSVTRIEPVHRKADWAFYLDANERGGLGATLEFNLIEFVFGEVGLEKLNCEVIETNEAVIRMHKKFGFEQEGFRRSNIVKHGKRIGVYFLGLTKSDWASNRASILARYEPILSKFKVTLHHSESSVTTGI